MWGSLYPIYFAEPVIGLKNTFILGGYTNNLKMYTLDGDYSMKLMHQFPTISKQISSVHFSPTGRYMMVPEYDQTMLRIWDMKTKQQISQVENLGRFISQVVSLNDLEYAVVGYDAVTLIQYPKLELVKESELASTNTSSSSSTMSASL